MSTRCDESFLKIWAHSPEKPIFRVSNKFFTQKLNALHQIYFLRVPINWVLRTVILQRPYYIPVLSIGAGAAFTVGPVQIRRSSKFDKIKLSDCWSTYRKRPAAVVEREVRNKKRTIKIGRQFVKVQEAHNLSVCPLLPSFQCSSACDFLAIHAHAFPIEDRRWNLKLSCT